MIRKQPELSADAAMLQTPTTRAARLALHGLALRRIRRSARPMEHPQEHPQENPQIDAILGMNCKS